MLAVAKHLEEENPLYAGKVAFRGIECRVNQDMRFQGDRYSYFVEDWRERFARNAE